MAADSRRDWAPDTHTRFRPARLAAYKALPAEAKIIRTRFFARVGLWA